MANLTKRKEGQQPRAWDPVRRMRDLFEWDPFAEMMPAYRGEEWGPAFTPSFEVKETKDGYVFKADLPGIDEKDLDIALSGNRLTISGKREAEERHAEETFFTYERSYGTFTRAFTLPEGIDAEHIDADLKNGVLTLTVPKKPESQPKRISLKGMVEKVKEKVKA